MQSNGKGVSSQRQSAALKLVHEWACVGRRIRYQIQRLGSYMPVGSTQERELDESIRQIDSLLTRCERLHVPLKETDDAT